MTQTNRTKGLVRMALMGTAFITLTIILVVFQPGSPRHASNEVRPEASVTRVAPALDNITASVEDSAVAGTATVESGQFAATVQSPQPNAPSSMRDLTFVAISNLKTATTGETPAPGEPGSLLHSVVQRSIGVTPAQIAPQEEPEIVAEQTTRRPASGSYFVLPGDTLISIAQDVYGDAEMASNIFLNNTDVLSRPDRLTVGMVLKLP